MDLGDSQSNSIAYILCSTIPNFPSMGFILFIQKWKTFISFNFIQGLEHPNPNVQLRYYECIDIFLVGSSDLLSSSTYGVCNPLIWNFLRIMFITIF